MARQFSIDFDERSWRFIEQQLKTGRYDSIDDVVQEGLRLLESHHSRLEALIEGESSGKAESVDFDAFLAKRRAEWLRQQDEDPS